MTDLARSLAGMNLHPVFLAVVVLRSINERCHFKHLERTDGSDINS